MIALACLRARLGRLRRDRHGVAAIEFAMISPVLLVLTFGSIEIAHMLNVQVTLDGAVAEAARQAAVRLNDSEDDRDAVMRRYITHYMSAHPMAAGGQVTISTTVYRTFGSSYPEGYTDSNENGRYDGPSPGVAGEPFQDRNRNGVRDLAVPVTGKLGGPGDVVSYTAEYPSALYFDFFTVITGSTGFTLKATTVLRNEPVKTNRAGT